MLTGTSHSTIDGKREGFVIIYYNNNYKLLATIELVAFFSWNI